MCGICGIAYPSQLNQHVDAGRLVIMRDSLKHRGPDDAGVWINKGVGLGHRRLSIVDLGGGHQPMSNEDGTVWIAFNGEIYNHRQLRPGLEERGHVYRTQSDTETIVHLYEQWGPDCVAKLEGMFAYAIWDSGRRRLVLARDRLGIKPLYYVLKGDGTLYFASEIKALIAGQAIPPELNYDALADYSANRYTCGDETLFRGVKRLPPGHTLVWRDGQIHVAPYWDLSFTKSSIALSEKKYVECFGEVFRESVRSHLMSDVPLGVFLSGGIDSSAITAVMSTMAKEPIKTFSVAFAEREANELEYARAVSGAFRTDHHELVVSPHQFFDMLPTLVYQEDEPIAYSSSVPLVLRRGTGRKARQGRADGRRQRRIAGRLQQVSRNDPQPEPRSNLSANNTRVRPAVREAGDRKLEHDFQRRAETSADLPRLPSEIRDIYFNNFAVFSPSMQDQLFTEETREQMGLTDPYRTSLKYIEESDAQNLLDQLLAVDLKTYLHELLMKQDQMSMAASIESRVPFLDHKLVEFAAHLPVEMKLRGWTTKYVLRQAMRTVLPKQILVRKKMGFPVPVGSWLRGPFSHLLDEYVLSPRVRERNIFKHEYLCELVRGTRR